jgi:hypothetical protein
MKTDNYHFYKINMENTFTANGEFANANKFELIWVREKVNGEYDAPSILSDDEYLDYTLWRKFNDDTLYKKHLPNTLVISGRNPNIIFHGGCLGCLSQRLNGFERCKGCSYFRYTPRNTKPNLHIKGEIADTMGEDEIYNALK